MIMVRIGPEGFRRWELTRRIDIIDGFGSYTDHFMKCPVFLGIGAVAYKYCMSLSDPS